MTSGKRIPDDKSRLSFANAQVIVVLTSIPGHAFTTL